MKTYSYFECLLDESGILYLSINREDKLNALNIDLLNELKSLMTEVYELDEIKGVIIRGKGGKAFAAGADISEFSSFTEDKGRNMARNGHRIFRMIEMCPKPVIAAVNGFALGGGCELAMACHFRLASSNAKFGQPEVNLGIIPGYGGTQRLVHLIGKGRAMQLLMTGDMISADEAYHLGLVNHVLPDPEALMTEATGIMKKILSKAPIAIKNIIEAVDSCIEKGIDGMGKEIELFANCMTTADFREGTDAFLNKRKANFTGK